MPLFKGIHQWGKKHQDIGVKTVFINKGKVEF
jgi:hypothetical protein